MLSNLGGRIERPLKPATWMVIVAAAVVIIFNVAGKADVSTGRLATGITALALIATRRARSTRRSQSEREQAAPLSVGRHDDSPHRPVAP